MPYSIYQKPQKRVPGLLVLGVLLLVMLSISFIFKKDSAPVIVQNSSAIERVDIVNIRDTGFTVYWRTKKPTQGYILYGTDALSLEKKAFDQRDVSSRVDRRYNHVVTLSHVPHSQKVYFQLVVNGEALGQSAGVPFIAETARPLKSALDLEPIYGEIGRRSGSVEQEAVVIATIGKSRPLLTLTHDDGTFLFSPCCLYSAHSQEPFYPGKDDKVRLEIIAEDGTSKLIQSSLVQASPLEDRILVDVKDDIHVLAQSDGEAQKTSDTVEQKPEVLAASDSIIKYEPVDIIYPRDGVAIPGTRPLVRGVGEPKQVVKGRFTPTNRLFQITIDSDRNWVYQPSFDFPPGEHTLTVDTYGAQGQLVNFTRTFTILKSGEAVLGDATGSATLTPTTSPTPEITSTPVPTVLVTLTPTPPVTGFNILPFTLVSLVLIVIGTGIILLF